MNKTIKDKLDKFIKKGYKAYIVGGFVRDHLLGKESFDVDIATNALPKEVIEILGLDSFTNDSYGSLYFEEGKYNFDITTFRKELSYESRKPTEYEYIDTIEEDVVRRDFTINSLYMDIDDNIIDLVEGKKDLDNKLIRMVGDIDSKCKEDPLRILRAIRFYTILDFDLDEDLYNYIKNNTYLVKSLSNERIKEELDRILENSNKMKGIKLIQDLGIDKELEIDIPEDLKYTSSVLGMYYQIGTKLVFTKNEKDILDRIDKIIKYGIIDNITLYQYGLYACSIAGELLDVDQSAISNEYKELPIYNRSDIDITGSDIISILKIEPGEKIEEILSDIEINILYNKLDNELNSIAEYVDKNWR
jgi:tRNA nucleotidyltransferase (CCA-adding enzyme)